MIKISIKDAQIGMVAAEPIKTPLGQILALPGTPLTRQLINKMKLYKVGSISIQNPFDAAAPQAGENTAKRDKVKPVPKTRSLLLSLTFPHRAALQSRPLTCSTTCAPLQTRCTHTV